MVISILFVVITRGNCTTGSWCNSLVCNAPMTVEASAQAMVTDGKTKAPPSGELQHQNRILFGTVIMTV